MRQTFFLRPRKPFACLRTFLWRARAATPRLTLGMARSLRRVRQHGTDRRPVGVVDPGTAPHVAFALGGLLGEDVALVGAGALDRAAAAHLEALGGAPLGFHLGHDFPTSLFSLTPGGPRSAGTLQKPRLSLMARYARAGFAATLGAILGASFLDASVLVASVFVASCFGFSAFAGGAPLFLGAGTITTSLPSRLRNFSPSCSSRSPNSLCAISRPRKRSVTFALSPSSRNSISLPSLIL